jgi:hypothetical protein
VAPLAGAIFRGAGYGGRTRDLNFGKVACCHYTKPACILLTSWIIADGWGKVKGFAKFLKSRPLLRFMILCRG